MGPRIERWGNSSDRCFAAVGGGGGGLAATGRKGQTEQRNITRACLESDPAYFVVPLTLLCLRGGFPSDAAEDAVLATGQPIVSLARARCHGQRVDNLIDF